MLNIEEKNTEEKKDYFDVQINHKYDDIELENFEDEMCDYHNGDLLAGIRGYGFDKPSQIQSKAIIPICRGEDLIAQAQAGSGKTAAFVIPSLALVNPKNIYPQVIILGNTRQLAGQIHNVMIEIGKKIIQNHNLKITLCVGGKTENNDTYTLLKEAYKSHILIGTSGKIIDLNETSIKKKYKHELLSDVSLIVLDEADALLKQEFIPQIKYILQHILHDAQICLFSATYPTEVLELTKKFMCVREPVKILVEKEKISVKAIKNFFVNVEYEKNKYDNLIDIYQKLNICQAVIFVNSIKKAEYLADMLQGSGHSVGVIHSDMDEKSKNLTLKNFRLSQTRILIGTDLISRGIDVQQVGIVINYDVPHDSDKYIHRVGRSGRFGRLGVAITFMTGTRDDIEKMKQIEYDYNIDFEELNNTKDIEKINDYLTGTKSN
jgi:translation initiation factor 4A